MLGLNEDVKSLRGGNYNTLISSASKVDNTKIDLQGYDECTTININLRILTSWLGQTRLMGRLTHQTQVMIDTLM